MDRYPGTTWMQSSVELYKIDGHVSDDPDQIDISKAPAMLQKEPKLLKQYGYHGCVEEDQVLTQNPIIMYTQDELCGYSALRILYCMSLGQTNFALPTGAYYAGMPAIVL